MVLPPNRPEILAEGEVEVFHAQNLGAAVEVARLRALLRRAAAEAGHAVEEAFGVRLPRVVEDLLHRPGLDHFAVVHHHHVVRDLGDHAHVVGDEHHRHAVVALEGGDKVEDLGLRRYVERRGRLVGDQHGRVTGERHRDHHALPHPAGILERVLFGGLFGARDLDHRQELDHPAGDVLLARLLVQADRFGHLVADGVDRREGRHRLLEDHRDVAAADRADLLAARIEPGKVDEILAAGSATVGVVTVEDHLAADDLPGRIDDLEDRPRGDGLARAGFAHDAGRPPPVQREGDVLHRLQHPLAQREHRVEVLDLQHDVAGFGSGAVGESCHVVAHGHQRA